jgi:hypothetical protein
MLILYFLQFSQWKSIYLRLQFGLVHAPNKAKILDFHHIKCAYPAKMNTKPILLLQEADICDVGEWIDPVT